MSGCGRRRIGEDDVRILVSYRGAPRIRGWETGAMVARAFRRLGHEVDEYARTYEDTKWVARDGMPEVFHPGYSDYVRQQSYDLHVYMEMNDPEPQYLNLRNIDADKRVGWFFDTSYYPHQIKNIANAMSFDWVFSANPNFGQDFFGPRTSFLPYAADKEHHWRPLDTSRELSVILVGSDRPERRKLIRTLNKVGVEAHLISGVFKEDYVDALASADIVVNENPPEGRGLLNMRTFEAPAAGALLVCQEGDYIERVLTKGVSVLTYTSPADLVGICKSLGPEVVYKTRAEGQNRVMEDHTYDNRAQEMLDVLGF